MKKVLAIIIAAVMCISIFTFGSHPFKTIAQAAANENNISVMNANVEPAVQSVDLEGINATEIKQNDVTEYYKNQDSIANLLSTATPATVGTTWAKTYGGGSNDNARSIQQTSDGGYIVAGYTHSFGAGGRDFLVIKLTSLGTVSWAKTYGGGSSDQAYSIQQTLDGGYIVVGRTCSFGSWSYNFLVIKLGANGTVSWAKTYGGSSNDFAYSIWQTSDGGYIVAGHTKSFGAGNWDFLVIKLNATGAVSWAKTYGGSTHDCANSIQQTSDGGYIVAGFTDSFGTNGDFLVIKLDASGDVSWAKTYGGTGCEETYFIESIQQTSDSGYIVAGYTRSFGAGDYDFLVIKLDSSGDVSWAKTYGGAGGDWAYFIQQTSDGGYIVTGDTKSFGVGKNDCLFIKLDSSGNVSWAKTYGGSNYEWPNSIQQTLDGGYIVAGYTNSFGGETVDSPNVGQIASFDATSINSSTVAADSNFLVIKLDSNGEIGGSCDYLQDCTPIVNSPSITGVEQTLTITEPGGLGATAPVIASSPDIQSNTVCEGTVEEEEEPVTPKPIPIFTVEASVSVYGGYAAVTPKEQAVQSGNPASVTINPDAGYHITGLTDNDNIVPMSKLTQNANGTYTYTIFAVYENHKIVVTLEKNKYTIKAKAGEGGTISPSGIVTVKYNETQSFTITPDSGYRIDKIVVDGKSITSTQQKYTFMNIKSSHTIEVTFARLPVKTPLLITLQINNPEITINGISKTIDEQNSKPIIVNDRTLIPIRVLIESLGGTVSWNGETREVTINLNYHTIILTIDNNTATVDGIKMQIDPGNSKVTPIIINGRTYLPLRFIMEHFNATVDWDNETRTVTIYYWP
jgi:uncharacterized delta-60 repeat protein